MTVKANYDLSAIHKICNYAALEGSDIISVLNSKPVNIMFTGITDTLAGNSASYLSDNNILLKIRFSKQPDASLAACLNKKTMNSIMSLLIEDFSIDDETDEMFEVGISALKQILNKICSRTYSKLYTDPSADESDINEITDIRIIKDIQSDCPDFTVTYSYMASFIINSDTPFGSVSIFIPSGFADSSRSFNETKAFISDNINNIPTVRKEHTRTGCDSCLSDTQFNNLNLLLDVPLELSVEIGSARYRIEDILSFTNGSIVDLDCTADTPVDVMVNGHLIAKGEIVVVDSSFGVRVTEIIQSGVTDIFR
ncbi:MAG: flagellar motor switch protein FliN [Oscillospiraceae bacterium]|nr:flagellar motor switch protein FliN [Oscillospiraceae bacterium]